MLAYVLLAIAETVGIFLVPFGGLGIWLQLLAAIVFAWQTNFSRLGPVPVFILVIIGVTAELARAFLARGPVPRDTQRKLGFAGIGGAGLGAAGGIPFPLVGSMFGALLGAALGSIVGAISARRTVTRGGMTRMIAATTLRASASVAIAAFILLILLR